MVQISRKLFAIGLISLSVPAAAQESDSLYQKKELSKTEIEVAFSYYDQDGNNSAVTGGVGTEELYVYAPSLNIKHAFNKKHNLNINTGADLITSASTDNINAVLSSASREDTRAYLNASYQINKPETGLSYSIGSGLSVESDYLSVPFFAGFNYASPDKMRSFDLGLKFFFDDLRWGRFDEEFKRPETLVYPNELRSTEWFDIYHRNSYNLKLGFSQVISRRLMTGVFPEIIFQDGLLSTPFHRVYFTNGSRRVENLPTERWKLPVGLKLNYFAGSKWILKSNYQFYWDSFGVLSNAFQFEMAYKINPKWTASFFGRFNKQEGTRYFQPYGQHDLEAEYYTSDFDLSSFDSFKTGVAFRFAPYFVGKKSWAYEQVYFRYTYFKRSDGLTSHILSLLFNFSFDGKKSK